MNIPALGASPPPTASPPAPAATSAAPQPASADIRPAVRPEDLRRSVDQINKFLENNSDVLFSIDEASGFSVVKVVDTQTNKVIRQFPSEQALEIGKNLKSFQGLLVNSKA